MARIRFSTCLQFPEHDVYIDLQVLAQIRGKTIGAMVEELVAQEKKILADKNISFDKMKENFLLKKASIKNKEG